MKKIVLVKFLLLFVPSVLTAQNNLPFSVFCIGDAGKDTMPGKALTLLKEQLILNPNSAVIFLGDNVYPSGLKLNDPLTIKRMESQLSILKEYKGRVYFIPGNHDWDAQKAKGLQTLANEEAYVNVYLKNKTTVLNKDQKTFLPENGLPGPQTVMLSDKLRLIIIDTQWFLHLHKKNKIISKAHTSQLFYHQLDSILSYAEKNNEQVIVAGHHPMFTNGKHSKKLQPWRFMVNYTPFQIFGLMGLNRLFSQDIEQPRYKRMKNKLLTIFNKHNNIIYISGHDHNLQYFKSGTNHYIVSGSGSKVSHCKKDLSGNCLYQEDHKTGFAEIEYQSDITKNMIFYREGEKKVYIK